MEAIESIKKAREALQTIKEACKVAGGEIVKDFNRIICVMPEIAFKTKVLQTDREIAENKARIVKDMIFDGGGFSGLNLKTVRDMVNKYWEGFQELLG